MLELSEIQKAIHADRGVSRRLFLAYGASLAAVPLLGERSAARAQSRVSFSSDPFTCGIASGDPTATGVVLWTRLAPKPLEAGGGLPPQAIEVRWEIAEDDKLAKVVRSGTVMATPELGHTVHVEVEGLKSDRWYWYRFTSGDAVSPVGRTRTMPDASTLAQKLRFAFASCQHYEQGLFTAYEQMAKDELDLVVHLGDYIYEYAGANGRVRKHVGNEIESLDDYRIRHALYRSEPLLRGMHALCPWLVTWDDHEVDNNYAGEISEQANVDAAALLARRANAYRAYYEMMPLRRTSLPSGPNMQLYRKGSFGRLAEFLVLDTRQYRSDQPNGDKASPLNDAALNPKNSLLGQKQRDWVQSSLLESKGTWNVLAQQVMMGLVGFPNESGPRYSMDQWPGCAAERMGLVQFMAERRVSNPVVLTGDIHSNWVNDLRVDDRKAEQPVVATEFVGTSISSGGNGTVKPRNHDALVAANPCIKFHNAERGYVRCTVTPRDWTSDYVVVDDVLKPGGKIHTRASFVVEAGTPGAKPA